MATAVTASPLADPAPPAPRRPRVLLIGATFGAVASGLAVLSMLAVYLQLRAEELAAGRTALPEGVGPAAHARATWAWPRSLMSAVTMAWVVDALRNDDRPHAYFALFSRWCSASPSSTAPSTCTSSSPLSPTSGPVAGLLYAITGAHLVMVVIGMLFFTVMGFQALGGQLTGRDAEGMSAAALYWYATIAVYVVVWYAVYITK